MGHRGNELTKGGVCGLPLHLSATQLHPAGLARTGRGLRGGPGGPAISSASWKSCPGAGNEDEVAMQLGSVLNVFVQKTLSN